MTAPIVVSPRENGQTLAAILKNRLGLSWSKVRELIASRQVRITNQTCTDDTRRLRTGQRVDIIAPRSAPVSRPKPTRKPPASLPRRDQPKIILTHVDDEVVVVDKPPGLTTMRHASEAAEFGPRGRKFLPTTLADHLKLLVPGPMIAVHRIDRDTTGLVVFARNPEAAKHLTKQFRDHTVARRYLAIVRGTPSDGRIESWLIPDRGDGRRGSGPTGEGQRAVTHVRVLERLGPCSLVECRLETGRTHQVRIHLGEAGCPLAAERIYDRPLHGAPRPDPSQSPRIALHATELGFAHPATGERLVWHVPLPPDLQAVINRLRSLQ